MPAPAGEPLGPRAMRELTRTLFWGVWLSILRVVLTESLFGWAPCQAVYSPALAPSLLMTHGHGDVGMMVSVTYMRPENADAVLESRTSAVPSGSRREAARWKAIAYSYRSH